jgi:hypothetical protein
VFGERPEISIEPFAVAQMLGSVLPPDITAAVFTVTAATAEAVQPVAVIVPTTV